MFPNPQGALPLPPRPDLDQYKKLAKDLVKACRSDSNAIGDWAERWLETLARLHGQTATLEVVRRTAEVEAFARKQLSKCALSEAQFVIARSHGFESWPKFAKHIDELRHASSETAEFESAADAIVTGDVATLQRLVRDNPDLIRARSTREHRATLFHYVSANGVEGYRQKTPKNAVDIARILLDAGAEVDATADVYGGGCTTLGLVATSAHPRHAGVQNALIDLLIDHGAAIDGSSRGRGLVDECLANGCPEAAEHLAALGAPLSLDGAAGVGRIDLVQRFLDKGVTEEAMTHAFITACGYGRKDIVELLLEHGVDVAATQRGDRQSALHFAVIGGHLEIVELLLARNAPLELRNAYGGTVLGQAAWSAAHGGDPDVYIPIMETLIAAGGKVAERHPPINDRVDEVLRRYGSEADPTLWWYGEGPRRAGS